MRICFGRVVVTDMFFVEVLDMKTIESVLAEVF